MNSLVYRTRTTELHLHLVFSSSVCFIWYKTECMDIVEVHYNCTVLTLISTPHPVPYK
jgi:hypothetical protein